MLSQSNALLKTFPDMRQKFDPQNIVTLRVPQEDGKEETFLAPFWAFSKMKCLTQRFKYSCTDTGQKEIILLRTEGGCYQLATINYILGRILQADHCLPLKDRPKKEVDAIFQEIWEFADGYYPPLLEDCRDYLKEKIFKDFDELLSYGTGVFEIDDKIILQTWIDQLSTYFRKYENKQCPIICYLIDDLLPAYANDFEAYQKARQFVLDSSSTTELIIERKVLRLDPHNPPPQQPHNIDRFYSMMEALIKGGDIHLIQSIFSKIPIKRHIQLINSAQFPTNSVGRFCKAALLLFRPNATSENYRAANEILDALNAEDLQDKRLDGMVKRLLPLSQSHSGLVEAAKEKRDALLQSNPNDPWALALFIHAREHLEINPENTERIQTLINQGLEQFPTNLDFKIAKLEFHHITQKEGEVLDLLKEVFAFDPRLETKAKSPKYSALTEHYASYLLRQGKINDAFQLFMKTTVPTLSRLESVLFIKILEAKQQSLRPLPHSNIAALLKKATSGGVPIDSHTLLMRGKHQFSQANYVKAKLDFNKAFNQFSPQNDGLFEFLHYKIEAHLWDLRCDIKQLKSKITTLSTEPKEIIDQLKQEIETPTKGIVKAIESTYLCLIDLKAFLENPVSFLAALPNGFISKELQKHAISTIPQEPPASQQQLNARKSALDSFIKVVLAEFQEASGSILLMLSTLNDAINPTSSLSIDPYMYEISAILKYSRNFFEEAYHDVNKALSAFPKEEKLRILRYKINIWRGNTTGIATLAALFIRDFLRGLKTVPSSE
jgi:hypothetical protein